MRPPYMKIFEKRLILVSGKGGVGKTTTAGALAILAARAGLKTLLCEVQPDGRLSKLFGENAEKDRQVAENVSFLYVSSEDSLVEYLKIYLRIKRLYNTIVNSTVMRYFLDAAPGFRELLILGKIWHESVLEEGRPRRRKWDLVIVDAPATGHGISFMGVAQATANMVRLGPIHNQAEEMINTLRDDKHTVLLTVTLPEEMPVNETVDFVSRVRSTLKIPVGPVVMNCMPGPIFPENKMPLWEGLRKSVAGDESSSGELRSLVGLAEMGLKRRRLALDYRSELERRLLRTNLVDVPFLERWNWDYRTLDEVGERLRDGLDL